LNLPADLIYFGVLGFDGPGYPDHFIHLLRYSFRRSKVVRVEKDSRDHHHYPRGYSGQGRGEDMKVPVDLRRARSRTFPADPGPDPLPEEGHLRRREPGRRLSP